MVELPSRPLAEVDPEFEKIALEGAAFTFGLPGTSIREKILQNLTQDVCRSQLGLAYRMHVTAAQMHGLSYAELLAASGSLPRTRATPPPRMLLPDSTRSRPKSAWTHTISALQRHLVRTEAPSKAFKPKTNG
jgi:hypothetical protein